MGEKCDSLASGHLDSLAARQPMEAEDHTPDLFALSSHRCYVLVLILMSLSLSLSLFLCLSFIYGEDTRYNRLCVVGLYLDR